MPHAARTPSFLTLLDALQRHGLEFVIAGGVAAVLHGAPVVSFAFDALVRVSDVNADRLLAALDELNARSSGNSPPLTSACHDILAGRHRLLATDAGSLDVLGFIGRAVEALRYRVSGTASG